MKRKPAKPAPKRRARGKRGPTSDAETLAALEALDVDWARASRRALTRLSNYIIEHVERGTLDPLVAVGAFRTLSSAINDRDAAVDPPVPSKP